MQDWSIDVMEILINTDRLAESKSSAVSRKFNLYSLSLKKKKKDYLECLCTGIHSRKK